ncbi:hypothetical protein CKO_01132 [Citrobacter koseri ATCC BAA-895]|uniref:Uncharacterized protein n=1 Tax=Citrobacter koseri (strain ATCC BAA-895 / CDC 4225-83 / SGSC4696) TaxID=290338 RepID=A8AFL1_CITK8|nr:hypothetical protein CKO_01132 [Citrobacter koseri ATCC BAA-895]
MFLFTSLGVLEFRAFSRHASFTHAEKLLVFSFAITCSICFSKLYEKRMFFITVLPVKFFIDIRCFSQLIHITVTFA